MNVDIVEVRKIYQKTKFLLCFLFCFLTLFLVGCMKNYDFATEEPFIIVTISPAGPDDYRNLYSENISIDNDGNLLLYTEESKDRIITEDAPVFQIQLNEKEENHVKDVIKEEKFLSVKKDVTTPSEDGTFSYITVNFQDTSKKVGGLNPDHPQFMEIRNYVFDLIEDEDKQEWRKEIEEHIWDLNSLRINGKTEYEMDDPFLIYSMEHIWNESSLNVYYYHVAINMNGNLEVYAEGGENVNVERDAPTLHVKLDNKQIDSLKVLIQTHFWKMNESIINSDGGNRMESITVHLTEESKTVRGIDPNHPRFIEIRRGIMNTIDQEDFAIWEKEIEEHIDEVNAE